MLVKRVETGKRWIEEAVQSLANDMGIRIDAMSWALCSSALAYRYYLILRSGERAAGGEFSFILLEDCPKSRSLQRVLKTNLALLLNILAGQNAGNAQPIEGVPARRTAEVATAA